jgi:hypothetical protein
MNKIGFTASGKRGGAAAVSAVGCGTGSSNYPFCRCCKFKSLALLQIRHVDSDELARRIQFSAATAAGRDRGGSLDNGSAGRIPFFALVRPAALAQWLSG